MEPTTVDSPSRIDYPLAPEAGGQIFEPPKSPVLTAIGLNRWLLVGCAILLCTIGLGYGLMRNPSYTSSATLQVGDVNPNSPGFLGYVQSASALATAFSRAIVAEPVLTAVKRGTGLPPTEAASRLSAEPIPLSPAFRVIATGPSQEAAMKLANTAAQGIVVYEGQSNGSNGQAQTLLHEYREASLDLHRAEVAVGRLLPQRGEALLHAAAARSAAKVRLRAIENAYVQSVTSQAPRRGLVSLLAGATTASSDRTSKIELYGLLGLVAGAFLGCVLAVAREQRRRRQTTEETGSAPA